MKPSSSPTASPVSPAWLGGWSPVTLFAGGIQGAFYDPSIMSTLWQDSAGTTPVTAAGQPVGKMLDLSGNGNHAIQATAINRPTLQQDGYGRYYLSFNGTNSWMYTSASISINGVGGVGNSAVVGFANANLTPQTMLFEVANRASLVRFMTNKQFAYVYYDPTGTSPQASASSSLVNNSIYVGSSRVSYALGQIQAWSNNVTGGAQTTTPNPFLTTAVQLNLGSQAGLGYFYQGSMYAGFAIARPLTDSELAAARTYIGGKCGVAI